MATISSFTPISKGIVRPPEKTRFISTTGRVKEFFFAKNPWKLPANHCQKVFKHCISCGSQRFSNKDWDKDNFPYMIGSSIVCPKDNCCDSLSTLTEFVPEKLYMNAGSNFKILKKGEEGFEIVKEITVMHTPFERRQAKISQDPQTISSSKKNVETDPCTLELFMHKGGDKIAPSNITKIAFYKHSAEKTALMACTCLGISNQSIVEAIFDPTNNDFNWFEFIARNGDIYCINVSGDRDLIYKQATTSPVLNEKEDVVIKIVVKSIFWGNECRLTGPQIKKERSEDPMLIHLFNSKFFKSINERSSTLGLARMLIKSNL